MRAACCALLLTAVLFRLAGQISWASAGSGPIERTQPTEGQDRLPAGETEGFAGMEYIPVLHAKLEFSADDAALVALANKTEQEIDTAALICEPLRFDLDADGPLILIVHSHATEAYTMADGDDYSETSDYRTEDTNYNVVRVGQALSDRLNALGIETIHDTTLYDAFGYYDAYERTETGIAAYLEQYPSIQMVIDVHRDAISDGEGGQLAMRAALDGQDSAQLLLVMGTDAGGLYHPNWSENLSFALKLQALCEKDAAGLFRKMSLRTGRFNQHMTPHSILLEVGTAGNTLREALRSVDFFAEELALLLTEGSIPP